MSEHSPRKEENRDRVTWRNRSGDVDKEKVKASDETPETDSGESVSSERYTSLISDGRLSHPVNAANAASIIEGLQRNYGNAYVQRLLSERAIQAKLTVNPPDDKYEKEADSVAETIVKSSSMMTQRQEEEELQTKTTGQSQQILQRQPEEEEEIQAKGVAGQVPDISETLEKRIDASRGSGQNLPDQMMSSFERHLGRDFSDVRIHADSEADALSRHLGARAFTTGQDIFFRAGDFDPQSTEGMKLISHEITHVAQQGGASIQMQSVDTGEKASPESKDKAESELAKAKDKALSAITKANIKALLYYAALCQKIGSEGPAMDAIDQAAKLALEQLKKQTKAFKVETSSTETAKELLDQMAMVQLLGAEGAEAEGEKAMEKLLAWAQVQLDNAASQFSTSPSLAAAKEVLQKAALVQLLGGEATAAIAAVTAWSEAETT